MVPVTATQGGATSVTGGTPICWRPSERMLVGELRPVTSATFWAATVALLPSALMVKGTVYWASRRRPGCTVPRATVDALTPRLAARAEVKAGMSALTDTALGTEDSTTCALTAKS